MKRHDYHKEKYQGKKKRQRSLAPPDVGGLINLASASGVLGDEDVKGLLRAVRETGDHDLAGLAQECLGRLALERMIDTDPFGPPVDPEEAAGYFVIGVIVNSGCLFGRRSSSR